MTTDNTTTALMARTLRHGADLLERIGGDVYIGTVYPFAPTTLSISADSLAEVQPWVDAAGSSLVARPHKDTVQHWARGAIDGTSIDICVVLPAGVPA